VLFSKKPVQLIMQLYLKLVGFGLHFRISVQHSRAGEVKLRYSVAGLLLRVYFEGAGAEAIGDFCAVEAVAMVGDVFVEDASGFVGDDMVAVKRCGLVNRCFTGIVAEGVISSRRFRS
jgi:hypothetical protein